MHFTPIGSTLSNEKPVIAANQRSTFSILWVRSWKQLELKTTCMHTLRPFIHCRLASSQAMVALPLQDLTKGRWPRECWHGQSMQSATNQTSNPHNFNDKTDLFQYCGKLHMKIVLFFCKFPWGCMLATVDRIIEYAIYSISFNKWTAHLSFDTNCQKHSKTMRSQMNFCHMTFSFKQRQWEAKWTYYAIWRSLSLARIFLSSFLTFRLGPGLLFGDGFFFFGGDFRFTSCFNSAVWTSNTITFTLWSSTIQILVQAVALFMWIQSWCQTLPGIIMLKHIQHLRYGTIILDTHNLDIDATWSIPVQWQGITATIGSPTTFPSIWRGLAAFIALLSRKDIFSMASTNWQSNYVSLHLKNNFKRESNY